MGVFVTELTFAIQVPVKFAAGGGVSVQSAQISDVALEYVLTNVLRTIPGVPCHLVVFVVVDAFNDVDLARLQSSQASERRRR